MYQGRVFAVSADKRRNLMAESARTHRLLGWVSLDPAVDNINADASSPAMQSAAEPTFWPNMLNWLHAIWKLKWGKIWLLLVGFVAFGVVYGLMTSHELAPAQTYEDAMAGDSKSAEPTLQYPTQYFAWQKVIACRPEVWVSTFNCDYTTKRCLRGKTEIDGSVFVGELLAEDRTTVTAHVMRRGNDWFDFDDGQVSFPDLPPDWPQTQPMQAFLDYFQPPNFDVGNCAPRPDPHPYKYINPDLEAAQRGG
jgi:hypothetical protein